MIYLLIYISFCILGILYGNRLKKKNKKLGFTNKIQIGVLILLLFIMGAKLGANQEVIHKLGNLGIVSFVFTVLALSGSVLFVFFARKLLGIGKEGDIDD